jgi:hypothetical protein
MADKDNSGTTARDRDRGFTEVDGGIPPKTVTERSSFGDLSYEMPNYKRSEFSPKSGPYDPYGHGGFVPRHDLPKERC